MVKSKSSRFYGNWVNQSGGSRSLSRRIMSALRQAHRCMGLSRRRLGLGLLGGGSKVSCVAGSSLLLALASTTMLSSSALADDWRGTYNNNFFDIRNWSNATAPHEYPLTAVTINTGNHVNNIVGTFDYDFGNYYLGSMMLDQIGVGTGSNANVILSFINPSPYANSTPITITTLNSPA